MSCIGVTISSIRAQNHFHADHLSHSQLRFHGSGNFVYQKYLSLQNTGSVWRSSTKITEASNGHLW